jgi:hypothetical protein
MKRLAIIGLLSHVFAGVGLTAFFSLSSAATTAVGDDFGGGKVVYIPKQGQQQGKSVGVQHGLIAADEDLPEVLSWSDAKVSCDSLKIHGYQDWYLPDKDELNKLFVNKRVLGGFVEAQYWNSTQHDEQKAWAQDFSMGNQDSYNKGVIFRVRPVRKF